MDKALVKTLKELGFGETRMLRFEQSYKAHKEAVGIGEEVEHLVNNYLSFEDLKIRQHARQRYVERVEGLDFEEPHMSNYIRDNLQRIDEELKHMLAHSRFLLKRQKNDGNGEIAFYLNEDILLVVNREADKGLVFLQTVVKRKIINVPQEFIAPMLKAAADELTKMFRDAEQNTELTEIDLKIRSLQEELKLLETARRQHERRGQRALKDIYEKANFIIGKEDMVWEDA